MSGFNAISRPDALIIGAGPVGLTMAAELLRHGLSVRIVDKNSAPTDKSKALVVWTRTLELLEKTGLAEQFVESGMLLDGASIYADGQRKIHLVMEASHTRYPRPVMIPQSKTEALLAKHLHAQGIEVERQVELVRFADCQSHVEAVLRHADGREEVVETSWLLGCDGAHSVVRHQLGLEFSGSSDQNDWWLADVHIEGPIVANEISVFWHAQGLLVFFPFEPGRYRIVGDLGPSTSPTRPPDPTLGQIQQMVAERGPAGLHIHDPIWLASFRINERKVSDYRVGRVFLAGDAAHIHSPAGGQGMNTGMQDAFNLAWKLALVHRQRGGEMLLDSYSQERSAIGDAVLAAAGTVTRVATLRNPISQFVRNHTASVLGSFSMFRQKATNALTELSVSYPHSPLNGEHTPGALLPWLTGGVKPGERLPDAIVTSAKSGQLVRLLSSLAGTEHHLLLLAATEETTAMEDLAGIAASAQAAYPELLRTHLVLAGPTLHAQSDDISTKFDEVWLDGERTIHTQHAAHQATLVLIRPDGYLAFRSQPAQWPVLAKHLSRYLSADLAVPHTLTTSATLPGMVGSSYTGSCRE
jgi:2-polyprenyl-6-methoxyphenol hydroxylase-like FAD-dependent oxidoreductase